MSLKWHRRFIFWGTWVATSWLLAEGAYGQGLLLILIGVAFDLWITSL